MTVGILHGRDERFHALQYSIRTNISQTELRIATYYNSEFELVKYYNYSIIILNRIREIFLRSFYIYIYMKRIICR